MYAGQQNFAVAFTWKAGRPEEHRFRVAVDEWRTLAQHYLYCFELESPLRERVLVRGPQDVYLLSQHVHVSVADAAAAVRRARWRVWWPRLRLLLIATRTGEASHSGLERLGAEHIGIIAESVLAPR